MMFKAIPSREINDDFSLSVELTELSKNIVAAANEAYAHFNKLVQAKTIALPAIAQAAIAKVNTIIDRL